MQVDEQRFGGIGRLYGREGLQRLADSHVAVVGIGGVGSWAAEALARSGVGEISLFDLDDVCVTNTNRQVHAIEGSVGKAKVEVMAARIRAINPACRVHAVADFVTRETMAEYIVDFDYLIDCIDSVAAKAALIAWCKRRKIPVITTGGADRIHAQMEDWLQCEWWDWQVWTANLTEQFAPGAFDHQLRAAPRVPLSRA